MNCLILLFSVLKCFSCIILMNTYKKYCADYIPCIYCEKLVNLYYAKSHLKTKKCVALQKLLSSEERDNLCLKYNREINRLKSELKIDI